MNIISSLLNRIKNKNKQEPKIPHGLKGIDLVGHREYVGGLWEELGKLQFEFLLKQGLKPSDIFLDIACGSLRAGVHLIPYLDKGHYLGLDKETILIDLGLKNEFGGLLTRKNPEFVITSKFEFEKFHKTPNFAIAQSLFTHLPPNEINKCFKKLRNYIDKDGVFFATYFITDHPFKNPSKAHDHGIFKYSIEETKNFGKLNGWNVQYIGNWNHPRNQQIVKYTPAN